MKIQHKRKLDEPIEIITRYSKISDVDLTKYPATLHLCELQIAAWPEHEATLATSLGNRSAEVMAVTESSAKMVIKLAEHHFGNVNKVCHDYRYFCQEMILQAELHFRRHGCYERSQVRQDPGRQGKPLSLGGFLRE